MTNEELQKLKELTKNAQEGARNGWPFYPEALAKTMKPDVVRELIELAERATQPAQPALDLGAQGEQARSWHKVWEVLSEVMPGFHNLSGIGTECAVMAIRKLAASAQDQVAAVRAVPDIEQKAKAAMYLDELTAAQEGQKWLNGFIAQGATIAYSEDSGPQAPRVKWAAIFNSYDRMVAGYMLTRDAMNWTELTLIDCAPKAQTAAPSPQPEPTGSIDTPELRELLRSLHACPTETLEIDLDETIASINAWKDAACAVAREEGFERYADQVLKEQNRADAAEAKLAAIQPQAAGDAQDAARYHWLKSQARIDERDGGYHKSYCLPNIEKESGTIGKPLYHVDFDSAVDAAMREQQP